MTSGNNIYQKTVKVTEDFLGPAGERFVDRQIVTHLDIEPEELNQKNLSLLVDWLVIAFALLSNNREDIRAYKAELNSLARNSK